MAVIKRAKKSIRKDEKELFKEIDDCVYEILKAKRQGLKEDAGDLDKELDSLIYKVLKEDADSE